MFPFDDVIMITEQMNWQDIFRHPTNMEPLNKLFNWRFEGDLISFMSLEFWTSDRKHDRCFQGIRKM